MGDFYLIMENILLIAQLADELGHIIVFEWPRYCTYWKETRVVEFLSLHKFVITHYDGCMYGLKPRGPDFISSSH